jgi:lipopolysaccharide biosynthesis protein
VSGPSDLIRPDPAPSPPVPAQGQGASLRSVAFYLPQFHPIPENDEWWGPGFTEWVNVVQARPRFRGHAQPHLPADLGYYDLRVAEVRAAQAALARSHGIDAFCYYHYWFEGRRLLERPFAEVLASGEPDLPFCLTWANESWTRVWDGGESQVLMRQTYSEEDDRCHLRALATAFSDRRYLRIGGRPVFLVYRPGRLPDARRTTDVWRREAERLGLGELYLCCVEAFEKEARPPGEWGFDAAVQFAPQVSLLGPRVGEPGRAVRAVRRAVHPRSPYRVNQVHRYDRAVEGHLGAAPPAYKRFPCVTPGWDNSSRRRGGGARVLVGSTPEAYEHWVRTVAERFTPYSPEENLLFVNAWNEWAEGNHLEPCQRWGRSYLEAHARGLAAARAADGLVRAVGGEP